MDLNRRTFLSFLAVPALVRATSLMPIYPERVWIEPGLYSIQRFPSGLFALTDFDPTGRLGEMLVTDRVRIRSRDLWAGPKPLCLTNSDRTINVRYALNGHGEVALGWDSPSAPMEFVTQTELRRATGSLNEPFVPSRFRAPFPVAGRRPFVIRELDG